MEKGMVISQLRSRKSAGDFAGALSVAYFQGKDRAGAISCKGNGLA
jgi:hypothetical protein